MEGDEATDVGFIQLVSAGLLGGFAVDDIKKHATFWDTVICFLPSEWLFKAWISILESSNVFLYLSSLSVFANYSIYICHQTTKCLENTSDISDIYYSLVIWNFSYRFRQWYISTASNFRHKFFCRCRAEKILSFPWVGMIFQNFPWVSPSVPEFFENNHFSRFCQVRTNPVEAKYSSWVKTKTSQSQSLTPENEPITITYTRKLG